MVHGLGPHSPSSTEHSQITAALQSQQANTPHTTEETSTHGSMSQIITISSSLPLASHLPE